MMWKGAKESICSIQLRSTATQIISFGSIVASALMIWNLLVLLTGSESPIVVVLSESMEPAFRRGDILFLNMKKSPIESGEIVVFKIEGKEIPIVHRVIKVHRRQETNEINILTKGDNNYLDDQYGMIYADGQEWLEQQHIAGRVIGYLPYVGWTTILMTEIPLIKYLLIGGLSLMAILLD